MGCTFNFNVLVPFPWRVRNGILTSVLYPPSVNPYGIHGMGGGLQKFQMDSTLFPDGFHGMGDGLHTFLRWIPWNGGLFHKSRLKFIWNKFISNIGKVKYLQCIE